MKITYWDEGIAAEFGIKHKYELVLTGITMFELELDDGQIFEVDEHKGLNSELIIRTFDGKLIVHPRASNAIRLQEQEIK